MSNQRYLFAAMLLGAVACAEIEEAPDTTSAGQALAKGKAVRSMGTGYVDLSAEFSDFWYSGWTMTAWINPEFTSSYYGPVFASAKTPDFWLGMGDYREGSGGFKDVGWPVLSLKINGNLTAYETPLLVKGAWNLLALRRTYAQEPFGLIHYEVWLNGVKLDSIDGTVAKQDPSTLDAPDGWIRLGRAPQRDYEFYGLIDDVRVYDYALDEKELIALFGGVDPDDKPSWDYTFDEEGTGSDYGAGYVIFSEHERVSIDGDASDAKIYDDPKYCSPTQVDYVLPFPAGEVWKVIQEPDSPGGSHNGYAAWTWDLVRPSGQTAGEKVTASAKGDIIFVKEDHAPPPGGDQEENKVWILHMPGWEMTSYLHLQRDSWTDVFLGGNPQMFPPDPGNDLTWLPVGLGDALAVVGDNANHLHTGMRPGESSSHTAPMAYVDYWASDDSGSTWSWVERGMPKKGQWIKR
jgi:hypothetical protein